MNINRVVRQYTTPLNEDGAGVANCLGFRVFYSLTGRDLEAKLATWLDQLKPSVEIVGLETCGKYGVIVCFSSETTAAE